METATISPATGKAVVLFDGLCPFCQRSIRILKKLDWLGIMHFQDCRDLANLPECREPLDPELLITEMHVVTPDRQRALPGFRAFRWMAWRMPLTILFAPLLYLPGVLWLGNTTYRWIARNRFNLVPCHDGQCRVPLKKN